MRLQITDPISIKSIGKFLFQKSRAKSLYLCAREGWGGGELQFAYGVRTIAVRADVAEVGSVEMDKEAFSSLFGLFTEDCPVDVWTEGAQVSFKQRNFIRSLNVLVESDGDLLSASPQAMRRRLLVQEKKTLMARLRGIDKELG